MLGALFQACAEENAGGANKSIHQSNPPRLFGILHRCDVANVPLSHLRPRIIRRHYYGEGHNQTEYEHYSRKSLSRGRSPGDSCANPSAHEGRDKAEDKTHY